MLIDKLKDWVQRGLVDNQVWQDIQDLVNFDVPTGAHVPIKVPEQVTPHDAVLSTTRNYELHLLPPANVFCEGYVFTGVCLSTERGACMARGVCKAGGYAWWGVCMAGAHA